MRHAQAYRGARRNLVLRGAGLPWVSLVQFTPGGREYRPREAAKGEKPQFFIRDAAGLRVGMVLECVKAWAPKMHDKLLPSSLLAAARIAEQREIARAAQ